MSGFVGYLLLSDRDLRGRTTPYRGMFRLGAHSKYPEEGSAEHELWLRLVEVSFEDDEHSLFVESRDESITLQKAYETLGYYYEVLECRQVDRGEASKPIVSSCEALGYDVANLRGESLVYDGAAGWSEAILNQESHQRSRCFPIWQMEYAYFHPKLNASQLLDDVRDACLLLEVERSLADLAPPSDLYHAEDCHVFCLGKVV